MYRKHMMEKEEAIAEEMFLTRVGELPVVTSALGQVKDMYTWTKERNGLLKYTLEAGEGAVCSVSGKALPVVSSKLQGSVHMANMVACAQLDRIEKSFPIITKPTEEVLAESKVVYDRTLKPTVDRVVGATTAVANTATGVKDYTVNTVTGVKDYTVNTVTGVKDYTVNTVTGVKDYTVNTVVGVKDRAVSTATGVKDYGVSSMNAALETSYGQKVLTSVDQVLNLGDQYVDRFFVEPEEDMADGGAMVDVKEGGAVNAASTMTKAANLTSKVRRRMYSRAVKDLQHVKKRSLETVDKLNFTVDLIQYAKENIDGVKERVNERLSTATSKVGEVWTEINKEEEEAKEENKENGYEARAIGVARRLTNQLKRNLRSISSTASSLPSGVQDTVAKARSFSEDLYHSFTSVSKFDELPRLMLDQTRDKLAFIGGLLSQISDQALSSRAVGWVVSKLMAKPNSTTTSTTSTNACVTTNQLSCVLPQPHQQGSLNTHQDERKRCPLWSWVPQRFRGWTGPLSIEKNYEAGLVLTFGSLHVQLGLLGGLALHMGYTEDSNNESQLQLWSSRSVKKAE